MINCYLSPKSGRCRLEQVELVGRYVKERGLGRGYRIRRNFPASKDPARYEEEEFVAHWRLLGGDFNFCRSPSDRFYPLAVPWDNDIEVGAIPVASPYNNTTAALAADGAGAHPEAMPVERAGGPAEEPDSLPPALISDLAEVARRAREEILRSEQKNNEDAFVQMEGEGELEAHLEQEDRYREGGISRASGHPEASRELAPPLEANLKAAADLVWEQCRPGEQDTTFAELREALCSVLGGEP